MEIWFHYVLIEGIRACISWQMYTRNCVAFLDYSEVVLLLISFSDYSESENKCTHEQFRNHSKASCAQECCTTVS